MYSLRLEVLRSNSLWWWWCCCWRWCCSWWCLKAPSWANIQVQQSRFEQGRFLDYGRRERERERDRERERERERERDIYIYAHIYICTYIYIYIYIYVDYIYILHDLLCPNPGNSGTIVYMASCRNLTINSNVFFAGSLWVGGLLPGTPRQPGLGAVSTGVHDGCGQALPSLF